MNVLRVVALADRIVGHLSHDAAHWRPALVRTPAGEPVPLAFRFVGGTPSWGASLLEALRLRVAAPYVTLDHADGEAIVGADATRGAAVDVELRADERHGDAGLAYELRFADSMDVRAGWFRLGEP